MAFFALLGFLGYLSSGNLRLSPLDFHTFHAWLGIFAFSSASFALAKAGLSRQKEKGHCFFGYVASLLAAASLLTGLILLSGQVLIEQQSLPQKAQEISSSRLPEIEASEFQGFSLMPLSAQGNNAIKGTQHIDRYSYRLHVKGLIEKELILTYDELLTLPTYSEVVYMPCVDGWGFFAKWTGIRVTDLLNLSGLKPQAKYIVFKTTDGYSTSLPLEYLQENKILLAFGINDLTLPPERGFPLQLVAKDRYGYKWAKWITEVEATDEDELGYWESRGYSNSARVGDLPFG